MLYSILSNIIRIALKFFFRKIEVKGSENIPAKGPMILVGNHPNTFMDPILLGYAVLPKQAHFLANGSIFKTRMARLVLSQLHTIPIYRKQDIHEKRDQLNEDAFAKCFEFLASGGVLMIFPEGNSINERKLRPLKTGTARIALGAEQQHNFALPLTILPIGLNYSNPTRFREEVMINIGKPFDVKMYEPLFQENPQEAVKELTSFIQQQLSSLIVVTADEQVDDLVKKIETVYKKEIIPHAKPTTVDVNLTQNIVKALQYFQENNPVLVRELKSKIDTYFETIKQFKLNDYLIGKSEDIRKGKLVRYVFYFITGFPLYVSGLLFNYIPYIIPSKIARWISKDEEYRAPIMMSAGIFTFPLYYTFVIWSFWIALPTVWTVVVLLLLMPLSGFFVLHYYKRLKNARSTFAYYRIFKRDKGVLQWFSDQRDEIIQLLETARQQYQ